MLPPDARFVIGIDLGTTNSAVSYARLDAADGKKPAIKRFEVPQLTGSGEFSRRPVLPSFLYIPGEHEIAEAAITHPWRMPTKNFSGIFARDFGANIPARLVSSAKSWLCENSVDRNAAILPWGSPASVRKVSPVEASAAYLDHMRQAWNLSRGEEEEEYLENQLVVVTVPASFDEVARDRTLAAASLASLKNIILLEEPLAAFYSWLAVHENDWSEKVSPDELILVCDVGGGTTDFTLITLSDEHGSPRFERIAVGDHLILGGDNIDLALARRVEAKLKKPLDADRLKTLCHQCRQAKENILEERSERERITLMGQGGSLIAGTISSVLDRAEVRETVLEQFFPLVDEGRVAANPGTKVRSAFGLAYESDPAVTAHLMRFLSRNAAETESRMSRPPVPDIVLFNGGALKPMPVQERIREALRQYYGLGDADRPRALINPDHDAAVSLGAAYYGLVKSGQGVKVGSGSPRSVYLGIATGEETADRPASAICVVERGLEENTRVELADRTFDVIANRRVRFDLYSSSFRSGDRHGDIIAVDDSVVPLPPVETIIQFGEKGAARNIPVHIEIEYTEIGTLVLWCRSLASSHRWQLQFQLRQAAAAMDIPDAGQVMDANLVESALSVVSEVLSEKKAGPAEKKKLTGLVHALTDLTKTSREKWPVSFLRAMADRLIDIRECRRISADHETRWLNLAGFAARPGIGDGFDAQRVTAFWKIYNQGICFANNAQVRVEWWIFLRRIACGLKPGQQRQFFQDVSSLILPGKGQGIKLSEQEQVEIWMALANMERLLVKDKITCGRALLTRIAKKNCKPQYLWAVSRLGARDMLYGSADRVVPPAEAAEWIDAIIGVDWPRPEAAAAAVCRLARKTGDRTRDVDAGLVEQLLSWLNEKNLAGEWASRITEVKAVEQQEQTLTYGESLPAGLILRS
ncbi:MAG: Hsp70 family protein [Thermodesulfobacteriota bacterium]